MHLRKPPAQAHDESPDTQSHIVAASISARDESALFAQRPEEHDSENDTSDSDSDDSGYYDVHDDSDERDVVEDLRKYLCSLWLFRVLKLLYFLLCPPSLREIGYIACFIVTLIVLLNCSRIVALQKKDYVWTSSAFVYNYRTAFGSSEPLGLLVGDSGNGRCPVGTLSHQKTEISPLVFDPRLVFEVCLPEIVPGRVMDELIDKKTSICDNPYRHLCGQWTDSLDTRAGLHRVKSVGPDAYNVLLQSTAKQLSESRSNAFAKFIRAPDATNRFYDFSFTEARIRVKGARETILAATAYSANFPALLQRAGMPNLAESGVALCAFDALLDHTDGEPWQSLADGLGANENYNVDAWINDVRSAAKYCGCKTDGGLVVTKGSLGDGAILQVDAAGPHSEFVCAATFQTEHRLGLLKFSALASAVLAQYSGLSSDSRAIPVTRIRVALPLPAELPFYGAHKIRLARVVFAEALEDRYTANVIEKYGRAELKALLFPIKACASADFSMHEQAHEIQSEIALCVGPINTLNPYDAALVVQLCQNKYGRRISGPLFEAHIPAAASVRSEKTNSVVFTPALLTHGWVGKQLKHPADIVVHLYYPLLGAIFDAEFPQQPAVERDKKIIATLHGCFSQMLTPDVWMQLIQQWCIAGTDVNRDRIQTRPVSSPFFFAGEEKTLKVTPAEHWKHVLLGNEAFRKTFKC